MGDTTWMMVSDITGYWTSLVYVPGWNITLIDCTLYWDLGMRLFANTGVGLILMDGPQVLTILLEKMKRLKLECSRMPPLGDKHGGF